MNHDPQAHYAGNASHAGDGGQARPLRIRIEFAQASDPGRDPNKQINEDSCGYAETRLGHLAVLCDGMGGHYGGKEASRTAITTIFEVFEQIPATTSGQHALKLAIEEAGRRVYQLGGPPDNRARPGSTVVAMLVSDRGVDVAHVGDSRAYVIRSNQIYPLTRDHSMVQGMIDAGMLTEESAMGHPDSNKITRALGMRVDVDVEVRPETMELFPGDILLQSSDGLTDLALGRDILGCARQALASGGVENACNMLVRMANDRGGHDNITVQIVRIAETAQSTGAEPRRATPQTYPGTDGRASHGQPHGQALAHAPAATTVPGLAPQQPRMEPTAAMPAMNMPGFDGTPHPPGAQESGPMPVAQTLPGATTMWVPASGGAPQGHGHPSIPQTASHTYPGLPQAGPTAPHGAAPHGAAPPQAQPYGNPPSTPATQSTQSMPTPYPPAVTPTPTPYGMYPQGPQAGALPPGAMTPYPPAGMTAGTAGGTPVTVSRGGIVFVILGLSGVIAVLILVIVWALWLRS